MMDSLRNFLSGPAGILVILLLGLPFVFLGTGSLGTGFTGSFGSINGEDVTETDVALASSSAVQRFQSIYGEDFDFNMLDEDFKNQSIKQELILQKVLLAEARSLGFINESTRNETKKEIIQSPIFQIDGIFDEGVYEAQVNSNGITKESYIDVMTDFTASDLYRVSLNTVMHSLSMLSAWVRSSAAIFRLASAFSMRSRSFIRLSSTPAGFSETSCRAFDASVFRAVNCSICLVAEFRRSSQ